MVIIECVMGYVNDWHIYICAHCIIGTVEKQTEIQLTTHVHQVVQVKWFRVAASMGTIKQGEFYFGLHVPVPCDDTKQATG